MASRTCNHLHGTGSRLLAFPSSSLGSVSVEDALPWIWGGRDGDGCVEVRGETHHAACAAAQCGCALLEIRRSHRDGVACWVISDRNVWCEVDCGSPCYYKSNSLETGSEAQLCTLNGPTPGLRCMPSKTESRRSLHPLYVLTSLQASRESTAKDGIASSSVGLCRRAGTLSLLTDAIQFRKLDSDDDLSYAGRRI